MRRQKTNHPVTHSGFIRGKVLLGIVAIGLVTALGWAWLHKGKPPAPSAPLKSAAPEPKPFVIHPPGNLPRPVLDVFEAQLVLDRQGLSPGLIDGKLGFQTRAALRVFQEELGLPATGSLDSQTKSNLLLASPSLANYTVTTNDLARLQPWSKSWVGRSQQTALEHESILELVAEKTHSHPTFIRQLNPDVVDWTNTPAGTVLQIPDITPAGQPGRAAFVRIKLSEKVLQACDASSNLITQFPCSIAKLVEKRPVGELHVTQIIPHPNYTFKPELFPESPEARTLTNRLILQPGPNNPVGTVWIGLDREGYGIHGTPKPEEVGRTESHGCFRLANWNAELLMKMVWMDMPVYVEP